MAIAAVMCGCGLDAGEEETSGSGEATVTGSGNEYLAVVNDDSAYIEYLDATLDIKEAEFEEDDFDEQTYLKVEMDFMNDSTIYRADGDEDTDFYMDSLTKAFVLQAIQDGNVIEHRSEIEAETIEESNSWRLIDSGKSLECELYFPVEPDSPVTLQVLNPDGEDTVMAELQFTP